jgi:hypothetical protein
MEGGVGEDVAIVETVHTTASKVLGHADTECCPESRHLGLDDLQPDLITKLLSPLPKPRPANQQPADRGTCRQGNE